MTVLRVRFRRLAARPWFSVAAVGLLSFAVSATLGAIREPTPRYHDEFAYLLAADTFARGRLSNPTPDGWENLETFHVLMRPRYAAKYPPGQGLILALGQVLAGRPIVGAWVSVALGCSAVSWMLRGWTRPRWALLGGVLAALHHGVHGGIDASGSHYSWTQSFWGGGVAMLGGALVLGSVARLVKSPEWVDALFAGLGVVLLAGTRPAEGPIVSSLALTYVAFRAARDRGLLRALIRPRILLTFAGVTSTGLAGLLYSNWSVTGSAFTMPYAAYEAEYDPVQVFTLWGAPRGGLTYRHAALDSFYNGWCLDLWAAQRTPGGWLAFHAERLGWAWTFFVGPLVLPVLMVPTFASRGVKPRLASGCILSIVGVHLMSMGLHPHYLAPAAGAFFYLVVEGWRRLAVLRIGTLRVGRFLVAVTWLGVALKLGLVAHARAFAPPGWETQRAEVARSLDLERGRHVVVVRYGPGHDVHQEWVYNGADVDGSRVVWARETDGPSMRRFLAAYSDRRAWLVEPDTDPSRLAPYLVAPSRSSSRADSSAPPGMPASHVQ